MVRPQTVGYLGGGGRSALDSKPQTATQVGNTAVREGGAMSLTEDSVLECVDSLFFENVAQVLTPIPLDGEGEGEAER